VCSASLRPPTAAEDLFAATDAGAVVGHDLTLAVAAFAHDGVVRHALQRLKYGHAQAVARSLVRPALPAFERLLAVSGPATLMPVPVHRRRLNERGYNQAALLTTHLARATGLPELDALTRVTATRRQHRLDRETRLRNLADAFAVRPASRPFVGGTIILVDDILTTAATLESCARVLRRAGSASVYGFCIAREV
jgi:ComF family protein